MPNNDGWAWACTDGACTNNGRVNAKAGVGVFFGSKNECNVSARFRGRQTNNCAEINAACIAIRQALEWDSPGIRIYTDSDHVYKGGTSWIRNWKRYGWYNQNGDPVRNLKDYQRLDRLIERMGGNVEFHKVKAHKRNFGNNQADKLAKEGADMDAGENSPLDYDSENDSDFDQKKYGYY